MTKVQLSSPWLEQLGQRPSVRLDGNHQADVAVVGAGIAGVTTAYFLLKHTWKRIALIEADRVAHGATGHSGGQLVSYFERPLADIANEFGLEMAADGQKAIESAWDLLEDIRHDLRLETPCHIVKGYVGFTNFDEFMVHLRSNKKRAKAGLLTETMLIADSFADRKKIPRSFKGLYTLVPHGEILSLLQTKDRHYIAAFADKKGVMNNARFCEETIAKLMEGYPNRFTLAEQTPVSVVKLYKNDAELLAGPYVVRAKRVVLCTNGFENIKIENHAGASIDVKFHHLVRGSVSYMAAFAEEPQMTPMAVSYLSSHLKEVANPHDPNPYFFLTRRPHEENSHSSLVCVGGPEVLMDDTSGYTRRHPYPDEVKKLIDRFVQKTYRDAGRHLKRTHLWHSLVGYTPNGIRCVGAEPCNPILMYNLGCNGVGILPSIYGSLRISQIIKGKKLKPSIFDPADLRCMLPGERSGEDIVASDRWFERHTVWGFVIFWTLMIAALVAFYLVKGR